MPRPPITVTAAGARALGASIEKWEKIVAGTGKDYGSYNCPLCAKFLRANVNLISCGKCPVAQDTGQHGCRGTPYDDWSKRDTPRNARRQLRYLRRLAARVVIVRKVKP